MTGLRSDIMMVTVAASRHFLATDPNVTTTWTWKWQTIIHMQIAIKLSRPYTAPAEEHSDNSAHTHPPVTTQTIPLIYLKPLHYYDLFQTGFNVSKTTPA